MCIEMWTPLLFSQDTFVTTQFTEMSIQLGAQFMIKSTPWNKDTSIIQLGAQFMHPLK